MKTLQELFSMIRREADGGAGGGSTDTPPPASTHPPAADAQPPHPAADAPPKADPPPPASGNHPPADEQPPAAEPKNILDADDVPPPAAQPPAAAPDDKAIVDYVGSIKIDLGNGPDGKPIQPDSEALKAIAPVLLKHKLPADAASELVKAYADYGQKQFAAMQAQEKEVVSGLIKQTRDELGADLPTFAADAKKGGRFLFGDQLWAEFVSVPAFANDVRIVKALAALGRSIKNDRGPGGGGAGGAEEKDFAEKWINSSNRGKG